MLDVSQGRRTQVVKGEVCKTSMQRFESARRLHFPPSAPYPALNSAILFCARGCINRKPNSWSST